MPILPVAFSLMASFISSITILGVSNEIYQFGTQFVIINFSYGKFNNDLKSKNVRLGNYLSFFFFFLIAIFGLINHH